MEIVQNRTQAVRVFTLLLALYREKRYPYDEILRSLPQSLVTPQIKFDPRMHARFLFYLTHMMRGRINSEVAARELVSLWNDRADLFEPVSAAAIAVPELLELLNRNMPLDPSGEIAKFWIENSSRLNFWGGDPRHIFTGITSADEIRRRMCNIRRDIAVVDRRQLGFLGFQEKMASMLAYFLMDAGLIAPFVIAPAVDFHLMRVMINTGVLVVPSEFKSPRAIALSGVNLIEWYCKKYKVGTVELGDALWLLSRLLCRHAPGAVTEWTSKEIGAYMRTCARCPVEGHCQMFVPADQYYRRARENGSSGGARIIATVVRSQLPPLHRPSLLFSDLPRVRRPGSS